MTAKLRPLIVGNWKMNGTSAALAEAQAMSERLAANPADARVVICPPATLIERMSRLLRDGPIAVGGQDLHPRGSGAFTGDVSAEMLVDAGAAYVIVGHSERRAAYGETDAMVAAKALTAIGAGLLPIICVGESLAERKAGAAASVVARQVEGSTPSNRATFAVAYEPIWAIGSGQTPTTGEIEAVHRTLRDALVARLGQAGAGVPILYGGSVTPRNAQAVLHTPEVGGALVGGASLKAESFLAIIPAA